MRHARSSFVVGVTLWAGLAAFGGCADENDPESGVQTDDLQGKPRKGPAPEPRACGARAGDTCTESEFCSFTRDAICGFADATGVCAPRPEACFDLYAPVCGCDGQTYGNECYANAAGVSAQSDGECPIEEDAGAGTDGSTGDGSCGAPGAVCGGFAGLPCAAGEFCNLEPAVGGLGCDVADATGVCQVIPQACTREYAPVCGCDGVTYGNACTAHAAGVSIASQGECGGSGGRICGGLIGGACAEGEYCDFPPDALCGAADATGVCAPRPEACQDVYEPVCGCDDKTYGNACEANAAGVSVASEGECATTPTVSCDPRDALCRRLPPECPAGHVASVVGRCFGDCVPVEQCACAEAAECPNPNEYTCHLSAGHCGPYVN